MQIATVRRYPVKSMLGETVAESEIDERGLVGDRGVGLLDVATGRVATAKHPRLWRELLRYSATLTESGVRVTAPDGSAVAVTDEELSARLGRQVRVLDRRPPGVEVERPDPEDVLAHGVEAEVPFATLEIAQGAPGETFVDYAPVHLITTATLDHLGMDALRYRPNLVVTGGEPFVENDWVGREITVGGVRLRGVLPTPRCSVPTLAHGDLPPEPDAVRPLLRANRIEVPGFGVLPCAGVYAQVLAAGMVRTGDPVAVVD